MRGKQRRLKLTREQAKQDEGDTEGENTNPKDKGEKSLLSKGLRRERKGKAFAVSA